MPSISIPKKLAEALRAKASPKLKAEARDWRGMLYTDFVRELGVRLTPGQWVLTRVAYDGLEPEDLPDTWPEGLKAEPGDLCESPRAVAVQLFGPVDRFPAEARRVLVVVAGGRGGKTYAIGALRALHLALSCPLDMLAPGEEAVAAIIAPDPRQRKQAYNYVKGAAEKHPGIAGLIDGKPGKEAFTLVRVDGARVMIESVPAKRGGSAGRGRSLVCAVLEEAAFFLDADHVVNDVEVFRAVTPRVVSGGQTIVSSTPWSEAGLLYQEFIANHPAPKCAAPHLTEPGYPHRAIAAHAPTLRLRNVEETRAVVAAQYASDPVNAAREYGAQFMSAGTAQLFTGPALMAAIDKTLLLGAEGPSEYGVRAMGVDLGFTNDASVGAVVERTEERYRLLDYLERLPEAGRALKPSEVFQGLVAVAKRYELQEMVADGHYAESAREAFYDADLHFISAGKGQQGKADMYAEARRVFEEGLIAIPKDERLLAQLRDVRRKPLPGGGYAILQTRSKGGGHGDIATALVHAVWRLRLARLPERPKTKPADPVERDAQEWVERYRTRREKEARAEQAGEWAYAPTQTPGGRWSWD